MPKSTTYSSVFFSWFLLIALGIIWGLSFMGVELALRSYTPLTIATFRIVFAALLLFALCIFTGNQLPRVSDKNGKRILLHCLGMGLFSNAIPFTLLSWGQINVSSSFAGISMAVVPLVVLPLSHYLIPNQRMTKVKLIGFVIGFIGVVILIGPGSINFTTNSIIIFAQIACVLASVCYACGSIITKLAPTSNLLSFTSCSLLFAATAMLPITVYIDGLPAINYDLAFFGLIYLGLFPTALATIMLVLLIRLKGPPFLSLVNYQVPIWAVIFGMFILQEHLPSQFIFALIFILIGLGISEFKKN